MNTTKSATISENTAKICILTSGHNPFDGRIFGREIRSMINHFNNITLIAPGTGTEQNPEEKLHLITFEPRRTTNLLHRVVPLLRLLRLALQQKSDVYHCHEPDALVVGLLCKLLFKSAVIYDAHEYHPEQLAGRTPYRLKGVVIFVFSLIERILVSMVDAVITVNEDLVQRYEQWGATAFLVPNYPHIDWYSPSHKIVTHNDQVTGIFVGGTERREVYSVVEGLGKIHKEHPELSLLIVGRIAVSDKTVIDQIVDHYNLRDCVQMRGIVAHNAIPDLLAQADFGFVTHAPYEVGAKSIATKTFEYMAAGLPILTDNITATHELITKEDAGWYFVGHDPMRIADTLRLIVSDSSARQQKGHHARAAFEARYNWQVILPNLLAAYTFVLKRLHTQEGDDKL